MVSRRRRTRTLREDPDKTPYDPSEPRDEKHDS
jgi:hypothetical protein